VSKGKAKTKQTSRQRNRNGRSGKRKQVKRMEDVEEKSGWSS
jgi:hypothetical protein